MAFFISVVIFTLWLYNEGTMIGLSSSGIVGFALKRPIMQKPLHGG
jgi:hypothetical protein